MRLGLNLGYLVGSEDPRGQLRLTAHAESLGYAVVWAAEAYGSDSPTVLAWLAAQTPAMPAMTAAGLDVLAGGRFRLGLGVSGPQVSEGWHGVRFDKPLARTREYVEIVRMALRRETVRYDGEHFRLPLPDGPGRPIKLTVHPVRTEIPVYLAAVGPRNLELTGQLADGWLAIFFSPEHADVSLQPLRAGRAAEGRDTSSRAAGDDVMTGVDVLRAYTALYVGGMGSRDQNFYNALARRMGFGAAAEEVQRLFLDRRHREAAAAVPFELIDGTALLGPRERVRDRLHAYAEAGVTTLSVATYDTTLDRRLHTLRTVAELIDESGLAA